MLHLAQNVPLQQNKPRLIVLIWAFCLFLGNLMRSSFSLLLLFLVFHKCLGEALNVWSLSPVQIHYFIKQESNWLISVVVTRKNFVVFTPLSLWQTHTRKLVYSKVIFLGSRLTQDTPSALSNGMINVSSVYWDCWWTQQWIFQGICPVPCSQLFWDRCGVWRLQVSFTSRLWYQIWWQCPRSNLASSLQHPGKIVLSFWVTWKKHL